MSKLFREKAEKSFHRTFTSGKQMQRIKYSTLILALLLVVGIIFFVVWLFTGTITRTIKTKGVVFPPAGIMIAYAQEDGIVDCVNVKIGDRVEVGELLAVVPDEIALSRPEYAVSATKTLAQAQSEIAGEYANHSFVRSPADGHVISILQKGTAVKAGDTLAIIAADSMEFSQSQVLVFFPTEYKSDIANGAPVQVSPNFAQREKYGYIDGYVYEYNDAIITRGDVVKQYNFYNIPNMLDDNETYFTGTINFVANDENDGGLRWSLESSSGLVPEIGTACDCTVIIEDMTPYEWLFGGM